jgi:hypothetical protein
MCSLLLSSVPFPLDIPFDSAIPCVFRLTRVISPSKSNCLLDRQYVEQESIVIGNASVSNATPSRNTLVNEEALALIIIVRPARQHANLSLVL